MPRQGSDAEKSSRRPPRRGHFLTHRDKEYLREGPEPVQKTKRIYTGKRIERERRAYKVAYARVVRESLRDARGALEDLAFLAEVMDVDWLLDAVTESRPLHPPTEAEVPDALQRDQIMRLGRSEAPLEAFLRRVVARVGWLRWPEDTVEEGRVVSTERRGLFVAVRLLAAIERGLNADEGRPVHHVSVTTRQDPGSDGQGLGFRGLTRTGR